MSEVLRKFAPFALVLANGVIINLGYVATNIYDVPEIVSVVLLPCLIVVTVGWFQRNLKRTMAISMGIIIFSTVLTHISLTTPVIFGIVEGELYRNMFVYAVFLRVMQYVIITSFFSLLTALVAGLAFE